MARFTVPAVVALAIAVALPTLWLGSEDAAVDAWTIGFALWQAMPFAALLLLRLSGFSDVGLVVTAVVVSAVTVAGYVAVSSSDSSTAAVGLLIFPLWWTLLVVVAFVVDIVVRHVVRRPDDRKAEPPRRTQAGEP
jgi:hypothetical protein